MAQCKNCQFQNMPGVTNCGRCGASMLLATAIINVHPPRATKWARRWRKSIVARMTRSANHSVNEAWSSIGGRLNIEPDAPLPDMPVLLRLIVPGWAQIYSGRGVLGQRMMVSYFTVLALTVLSYGSDISTFFLAAMFMLHASAVYDIAHHSTGMAGGRLSRFLVGIAVIAIGVYYPAWTGLEYVASPIVLRTDRGILKQGDVLLTSRIRGTSREPNAGDIVVYEIPHGQVPAVAQYGHVVYVTRGQRIDRILAESGQVVEWRDGVLTVNGKESELQPLGGAKFRETIKMTVPYGYYLILPSTEEFRGNAVIPNEQWAYWSKVPKENIVARVYWRNWPLSRYGRVK